MYNFRYHLVSICAVFISLALGLLLGAAIAGSDLARNTSDSLVDSMLSRFDELSVQNTKLQQQADANEALINQQTENWAKNRLDGRTIVTLLGSSDSDKALSQSLTTNLKQGNAAVVGVTVIQSQFGLDNPDIKTVLQRILPEVEGEDYQVTLIDRLVEEWSYSYVQSTVQSAGNASGPGAAGGSNAGSAEPTNDAPTAADAQIAEARYPGAIPVAPTTTVTTIEDAANSPDNATEDSPTTQEDQDNQEGQEAQAAEDDNKAPTATIDDGIDPQTSFQKTIYSRYTLTRALLSYGIISVNTDYQNLLEHKSPTIPESQAAALRVASAWHLPYAVNGLVNGLTTGDVNAPKTSSPGLALTTAFEQSGDDGKLPFPLWIKDAFKGAADDEEGSVNYYALLVQSSTLAVDVATSASTSNLSCVTSPTTAAGRYSIIALLSGAQSGIYGEDRPQESQFPALPKDSTGHAAFTNISQE